MVQAVYCSIETINKLDCLEKKEAKAKYVQIVEQSTKAACCSSIEEAGGMVVQEAQLYAKGKVSVFDWSFIINNVGNQLTFLDISGMGSIGGNVAASSLLKY